MSGNLTGNYTTVQTLTAGTPRVTISGTINAYGSVGVYTINRNGSGGPTATTLDAALIGPSPGTFTITNTGLIESAGPGASGHTDVGIGLALPGTVFNAGTVLAASGIGVLGTSGAYVENTKLIEGTQGLGIYLQSAGTVNNSGTISGVDNGVELGGGGFLTNAATAIITGSGNYGMQADGLATIQNAGRITGYVVGVVLDQGGTVFNSGTIAGTSTLANAISALNAPLTVNNTGLISGTGTFSAIYMQDSGTVINHGTILGQSSTPVYAGQSLAGTVINYGLIKTTGTDVSGIYWVAGGTITNNSLAVISGYSHGVYIRGANIAAVTNSGTINGIGTQTTSGTGIGLYSSIANLVSNTSSGLIEGVETGISITNAAGSVSNAGTVSGNNLYGVYLGAGGSVNNAGTIIGYRDGLRAKNVRATIVNSGFINATASTFTTGGTGSGNGLPPGTYFSHGIDIGNGRITNTSSGAVIGQAGIVISGTNSGGYILNAGHVTATGHAGLYIKSAGTIVNTGSVQAPKSGIELEGGGFVNNSGTDSAKTGVYLAAGGTVQNSKIITGTNFGIYDLSGISDIRNTGSINGTHAGILAFSASSYVYNSGSIGGSNTTFTLAGVAGFSTGIALLSSGTVSNASAGVVTGRIGIGIEGTTGTTSTIINAGVVNGNYLGVSTTEVTTLTNSDIIEALGTSLVTDNSNPFAGTGVNLNAGGSLMNEAGATIIGYETGVYLNGSAGVERSVTNAGVIKALGGTFGTAYASGVAMLDEGVVTNLAEGTISGLFGVYLSSGTVVNAGTITETGPTGAAVYIHGSGEIVDDPGAVFNGVVAFGDGGGLDLASGATAGTLSGFGTQFLGFIAVTVDNAAVWDIAGATSLANYITLTNDGTIAETDADALTINAAVTGTGEIILDPTTITLNGSVSAGQVVSFANTGDVLDLGDPSQFDGTIMDFGTGDTIDLTNTAFNSITGETFVNGVLTLSEAAGSITLTFANPSTFRMIPTLTAAAGGVDITATAAVCYAAGTQIATAAGEVPVEYLRIGDFVKTLHAGPQKIKWIGRRSYDGRFIAGNQDILPICIKRHAIAEDVPARDLFVSPGHAICIGGALIHAIRLVNGVSIIQAQAVESVTYYHVELESHEIIFAENCPAESFMGEVFRQQFQNAAGFEELYPGDSATETMCLPRLDSGFQLHAIQQRIAARAGITAQAAPEPGPLRGYLDQAGPTICFGWAQDIAAPEEPVCIDITADGRTIGRVLANLYRADVREAGYGSGYHGFEFLLPPGTTGRLDAVRAADRAALARPENAAAQAA
jgi:hypothetical protein